MLSDSPPERDVEWTEAGVEGAWRFVQRFWNTITDPANDVVKTTSANMPSGEFGEAALGLRKASHKAVAGITDAIEKFHFNLAVAQLYELSNTIRKAAPSLRKGDERDHWALREAMRMATQLIAPMIPHLAEECWAHLGEKGLVIQSPWPKADPALLAEDTTERQSLNKRLRYLLLKLGESTKDSSVMRESYYRDKLINK